MSDVSKYLPLSQRGSEDESNVTGDWSGHLAATLDELAALLEPLPSGAFDTTTGRPGFDVRTTVGHTLWHLGRSRLQRGQDVVRAVLGSRMTRAAALQQLSRSASPDTPSAGAAALRSRAQAITSGGHRSGVGDLSVAVVDAFTIAAALGRPLRVDPIASGAVALARSLSAPVEVRAVVSERALKATDAAWTVGRGRELTGTARELVLFLWGYAGLPGQGEAPAPTESATTAGEHPERREPDQNRDPSGQ